MTDKITIFDSAEHLKSERAIACFMTGALETEDPGFIAHAQRIVARAKNMMQSTSENSAVQPDGLARVVSGRRHSHSKTTTMQTAADQTNQG